MLIPVVLLIFLQIFAVVGLCYWIRREISRKQNEIEDKLRAALTQFVSSPDDSTPSPLAVLVDQTATVFAARLVGQVKAILSAAQGGNTAAANGAELDVAEAALASTNPTLGMLAALLPKKFKRGLLRNGQFTGALSSMLNKGNGSSSTSSNKIKD